MVFIMNMIDRCPKSCAVILHGGFVRSLQILILLNFVVAGVVWEAILSSYKSAWRLIERRNNIYFFQR